MILVFAKTYVLSDIISCEVCDFMIISLLRAKKANKDRNTDAIVPMIIKYQKATVIIPTKMP